MASTTDFYVYIFFGRACFKLIAAVASYFGIEIFRMDSRFHFFTILSFNILPQKLLRGAL